MSLTTLFITSTDNGSSLVFWASFRYGNFLSPWVFVAYGSLNCIFWNFTEIYFWKITIYHTLVPEVFLYFSQHEIASKRRERKTSGYLGLESHFNADANCQTRQIDNFKRTNSNSASTCLSSVIFLKQGRPGKLFV